MRLLIHFLLVFYSSSIFADTLQTSSNKVKQTLDLSLFYMYGADGKYELDENNITLQDSTRDRAMGSSLGLFEYSLTSGSFYLEAEFVNVYIAGSLFGDFSLAWNGYGFTAGVGLSHPNSRGTIVDSENNQFSSFGSVTDTHRWRVGPFYIGQTENSIYKLSLVYLSERNISDFVNYTGSEFEHKGVLFSASYAYYYANLGESVLIGSELELDSLLMSDVSYKTGQTDALVEIKPDFKSYYIANFLPLKLRLKF